MKSLLKLVSFSFLLTAFIVPVAFAVCPVCTVAVGAGLEGARLLGVDDVITGIWAGGLTLSLFFWTKRLVANYCTVCSLLCVVGVGLCPARRIFWC